MIRRSSCAGIFGAIEQRNHVFAWIQRRRAAVFRVVALARFAVRLHANLHASLRLRQSDGLHRHARLDHRRPDFLMRCEFTTTNDGWTCTVCGQKAHRSKRLPMCECRGKGGPSVLETSGKFREGCRTAIFRPACRRVRSRSTARLAICKRCPLFDGSICRHADCGCRISQQRKFLNKLAWADQSCPLGKWTAVSPDAD